MVRGRQSTTAARATLAGKGAVHWQPLAEANCPPLRLAPLIPHSYSAHSSRVRQIVAAVVVQTADWRAGLVAVAFSTRMQA